MSIEGSNLWQIEMIVSDLSFSLYEEVLSEISSVVMYREIESGLEKGKWKIEAICDTYPDLKSLDLSLSIISKSLGEDKPIYTFFPLEHKDWLKENLCRFKPVSAGRYYIYGSHIKERPPVSKISLCIDAATAFGSGEHQTTRGCLLALHNLAKDSHFRPEKILDIGCGSGILSLAAAKTYHRPILAIDIDSESVRVTKESSHRNKVYRYIRAEKGNGYKKGLVAKTSCYDLIFANILAKPLVSMAKDLQKHLSPFGLAVLSGMLTEQERWVLEAHRRVGLKLKRRYRIDEWSTLIVGKD